MIVDDSVWWISVEGKLGNVQKNVTKNIWILIETVPQFAFQNGISQVSQIIRCIEIFIGRNLQLNAKLTTFY